MRAAGLRSGVLLAPVVPGLTDGEPAMRAVASAAHAAGAVAFGSRPLKLDAAYLRSLEARIERASAGLRFADAPQRLSAPAQLTLAI